MDKKICSECGTENENEYSYCKNCGAPLTSKSSQGETEFIGNNPSPQGYGGAQAETDPSANFTPPTYTQYDYHGAQYSPYGSYDSYAIGGVPAEDVAFFVGKKSAEIMPKFIKMEITRSKTSWCWPAAILGFIFGPIGAALWFLYRKMYKIGILLLAAGTVITFSVAALTYNTDVNTVKSGVESFILGNFGSLSELINYFSNPQTLLFYIASGIQNISGLLTCVLSGVFGYHAYKEHCVKAIRSFRQNGIDPRYYRIGLASLGGVSGGMLAVGILAMFVIQSVASELMHILSLI